MAQSILEKKVEDHLIKRLDEMGIFHIKGKSVGLKGYPDRLVFAQEIFFVELKVGKEGGTYYTQTKMQKFWQKKIEASSGHYVLITGIKEVDDFVSKLKAVI